MDDCSSSGRSMRKAVFVVLFVVMFLVACSHESSIMQLQSAKLFTAMNDHVQFSEQKFSGNDATAIDDLVAQECQQGVGDKFVRATFEATSMTLIIYTTPDKKNVTCTILKPKKQNSIEARPASEAPDNETALLVNGESIAYTQITEALRALPEDQRTVNATNAIIMQLIDTTLLRQQAKEITVTQEEIAVSNSTDVARMRKLLTLRLLTDDVNVSDDDAKAYYLSNTDQFIQPEQATAHFLIINSRNRSLEQGQAIAREVAAKLNATEFCNLIAQYSDDDTNKHCGTYSVPRETLEPNLEVAAFSTPVNRTSIVTTDKGIYFVQTVQVTPAHVTPYSQIATTLQANLKNSMIQQRLDIYLTMLRNDAKIVSFLG
jgi:hypothetical protein